MVKNINKQIADKMLQAINNRSYDIFEQIMAKNFTDHHPGLGEGIDSRDQYIKQLQYFIEALDVQAELDVLMTKENYTIIHGSMSGTHKKQFLGIEPTGNDIEWTFIEVYRLESGKIQERWSLDDTGTLLGGLGVELF